MELLLEAQVERTNALRKAFKIVRVIDNHTVDDNCNEAKLYIDKAKNFMEKYKKSLDQRQKLVKKIKDVTVEFNKIASIAEEMREALLSDEEQYSKCFDVSDEDMVNRPNYTMLEVSPVPPNWANGFLNTPLQLEHNSNQSVSQDNKLPTIKNLLQNEMSSVPPYMKGRLTCDNVNTFIGTLNSVLKQKYSIIKLKKRDVKSKDKIQYCTWKSQEEEYRLRGKVFFTTEDLTDLGCCKMDKATDKLMQVLRHSKRLRQSRVPGKKELYIII